MRLEQILGVGVLAGLTGGLIVAVSSASAQSRKSAVETEERNIFQAPGPQVGVSVRDLDSSEARERTGVFVEAIQPNSPAEKAGLRRSDLIAKFDGENVRSARQFARLVRETAPGRTVSATVVRDGRSMELSLTPTMGPDAFGAWRRDDVLPHLREQLDGLSDLINRIPFEIEMRRLPIDAPRVRLGTSVEELTPQLAEFFGAKAGVLVSSVSDGSPASRAGLKAGDVITSINGVRVQSRADLVRALGDLNTDAEVTIGIVREKKDNSVTAKLEGSPRRPLRATPA